jgi:hypothetical protein
VTLDDALNELGIDHEIDADGARRAYLRLLKKRKPEVDRDGFMRLREAYELAKPYFEQIEMFRAIEKAASAEPSGVDGATELVRIEISPGVWVQFSRLQFSRPAETQPAELVAQDKLAAAEDKPPVMEDAAAVENVVAASESRNEQVPPVDEPPFEADVEPSANAPAELEVEPAAKEPDVESSEPSIDELIAEGKFKKAARRMRDQYRSAVQQGTIGVAVTAPYHAVLLLMRLHEKNRVDEARALEKDFADWLSSTGASVRIMAGPVGVMWMMARELSAVSKQFPPELREGISKAIIAGKLDDVQRRAGWFQLSDPARARNAALDLHAHAPTLSGLLGETLAPSEARTASGPSEVRRGGWAVVIALVMLTSVFRVFLSSPSSSPTSYHGQSDPGAYHRPSPSPSPDSYAPPKSIAAPDAGPAVNDSVKMDKATRDKMVKVAQQLEATAETKALKALENDRQIIQRARYVRVAIETGICGAAEAELNGFVTDMFGLSDPLKAALLPNAKKLDSMLRGACVKESAAKAPKDGGPKKP